MIFGSLGGACHPGRHYTQYVTAVVRDGRPQPAGWGASGVCILGWLGYVQALTASRRTSNATGPQRFETRSTRLIGHTRRRPLLLVRVAGRDWCGSGDLNPDEVALTSS
jgi:hypothetical protein